MLNIEISNAVKNLAKLFATIPDDQLDHPWHWKGHDEGVRFAAFLTLLELRTLAVKLAENRSTPQPVHHILGQYHAAYLDLQAALCGLPLEDANRAPSEKDWPIRRVYAHILGAEIGFSVVVKYALEGHRAGSWTPEPMSEQNQGRLIGMSMDEYKGLMNGSLDQLIVFHQSLHQKLLCEFADIHPEELTQPATFWEEERFPISYRLHRFEAHMRQHTIQIDKTLAAIGLAPTEGKRLVRMLYAAQAEVDGALIGVENTLPQERIEVADTVSARTAELMQIIENVK
jgi:hypothetical protein